MRSTRWLLPDVGGNAGGDLATVPGFRPTDLRSMAAAVAGPGYPVSDGATATPGIPKVATKKDQKVADHAAIMILCPQRCRR